VNAQHNVAVLTPERWEKDIQAFEEEDRKSPPPAGGVLFIGSSTIRLWKTLAEDFPDLPVINRGFGGSEIADSVHYIDRIVKPYQPRLIVFYAGTNDIANGKSPEQVQDDFQAFVERSRKAVAGVRIVFLAIKPTIARWSQEDKVEAANRLIADLIRRQPDLAFIDTARVLVEPDGRPKASLLAPDKLHFNAEGYRVWAAYLRPRITKLYREALYRPEDHRPLWAEP
jgi:lysophospholipase L1-like esterase